jgi:hypothetical protein
MADAGDSKSPVLTGVQVRLLSPAPSRINHLAKYPKLPDRAGCKNGVKSETGARRRREISTGERTGVSRDGFDTLVFK